MLFIAQEKTWCWDKWEKRNILYVVLECICMLIILAYNLYRGNNFLTWHRERYLHVFNLMVLVVIHHVTPTFIMKVLCLISNIKLLLVYILGNERLMTTFMLYSWSWDSSHQVTSHINKCIHVTHWTTWVYHTSVL